MSEILLEKEDAKVKPIDKHTLRKILLGFPIKTRDEMWDAEDRELKKHIIDLFKLDDAYDFEVKKFYKGSSRKKTIEKRDYIEVCVFTPKTFIEFDAFFKLYSPAIDMESKAELDAAYKDAQKHMNRLLSFNVNSMLQREQLAGFLNPELLDIHSIYDRKHERYRIRIFLNYSLYQEFRAGTELEDGLELRRIIDETRNVVKVIGQVLAQNNIESEVRK